MERGQPPPTARRNPHLEGLLAALAVLGHLCLFKLLPFLLFPVAVAIVTGGAGEGVAVKPVEDSPPPAQDRTASPKTPAQTAEMEQGCGARPPLADMPSTTRSPPGRGSRFLIESISEKRTTQWASVAFLGHDLTQTPCPWSQSHHLVLPRTRPRSTSPVPLS